MANPTPHVGDIGLVIELTIVDDGAPFPIADATTKQIILKADSGTAKVRTASFLADGLDGVLVYTTIAGDLDTADRWQAQAHAIGPGYAFHSDPHAFKVLANLDA